MYVLFFRFNKAPIGAHNKILECFLQVLFVLHFILNFKHIIFEIPYFFFFAPQTLNCKYLIKGLSPRKIKIKLISSCPYINRNDKMGSYKRSHKSVHWQTEKHPHWHPSEGTSAAIHQSSDVWSLWTILWCMDWFIHTWECPFIRIPMYGFKPYIGEWSIHRRMAHTSELRCSDMHSNVWLGLYPPDKDQFQRQCMNAKWRRH